MKKLLVAILSVTTILLSCFGLVACGGGEPKALSTPTLSVDGAVISWQAVENATSYVLKINDEENAVTDTTFDLSSRKDGSYVCMVKAKGDGENYKDSPYSESITMVIDTTAPDITATLKKQTYVVGYKFIPANELVLSATELAPVKIESFKLGETALSVENGTVLEYVEADNQGSYVVELSATDSMNNKKTEMVTIPVVLDVIKPEIVVEGDTEFVVQGGSSIDVTALPVSASDNSENVTLSYKVFYNGSNTAMDVTGYTFTTEDYGYYRVIVTAIDYSGNACEKQIILKVDGTYLYSLDKETNLNGWVSNKYGTKVTCDRELVTEANGNKYAKFITNQEYYQVTFNVALPNAEDLIAGQEYYVYFRLWTETELVNDERFVLTSGGNMSNAVGEIDFGNEYAVAKAEVIPLLDGGNIRISTFFIANNVDFTRGEVNFCIDDIMLVERWLCPVDVFSGTDEIDETTGDFKTVFTAADSTSRFYFPLLSNCDAGEVVKATLTYKIVSDAPMADNRGALGSYLGGTLILQPNTADYKTVTFDIKVNTSKDRDPAVIEGSATPNLAICFITAVGATLYIKDFTVEIYPEWSDMAVDITGGTDEVDENGNLKSTFSLAYSTFTFYPESISNCMAGDYVNVTLKYKIVSEVAMADNRGALGSYTKREDDQSAHAGTLFLTHNSDDFITVNFGTKVKENSKPYVDITFITAVSATMYIEEFKVVSDLEQAYGFNKRVVDLGLGGNEVYFLPSSTGMQTLSMVIKNSGGDIYIIDGGYDHNKWGGNDAKVLFDVISDLSGNNQKKVKGWFFTHPHTDHFGVFNDFINQYGSQVAVETIYYSWSEQESWYKQFTETPDVDMTEVNAFKSAIPTGTTVIEPKTGDVFNFGSFSFKILYSPANDNYPFTGNERYNFNNLSLVIKMTTSEKSILFLGDAGVAAGEWLLSNCLTTDLKADIVQMAHHGQGGVEEDVYQAIDPDYALFNCDKAVYENTSGRLKTLIVRGWMQKLGTTNYVSKDGMFIFN